VREYIEAQHAVIGDSGDLGFYNTGNGGKRGLVAAYASGRWCKVVSSD
jgi:hypothetical protein